MSLLVLNRHGGEALYSQICRALRREIAELHRPGDCLPSEQQLAQRFAVNRHTVRHAVEALIAEGLLERRHGRGTFVVDRLLDYPVGRATRFTETLESLGKSTSSKVLRKLLIPAHGGVAQHLALAPGAPVVWLETLRSVEERPFCLISHFLPQAQVGALLDDYTGGSLHEFLRARLGLRLRRTDSLVTAILPQGEDARLLGIAQTRPVLRVKSLNVDVTDARPLEYAVTRFRADRVQLHVSP